MRTRRRFVKSLVAAGAGFSFSGRIAHDLLAQGAQETAPRRREISIGKKRVKVIDVHAHLNVPAVIEVVKGTPFEKFAPTGALVGAERIAIMDKTGVDVEMLSQQAAPPWWFTITDRALAREVVRVQNEGTASVVAKYPDRFIGLASMPLQFPDLAAETLEDCITRLGFKGGGISAGWVGTKNLTDPEYDVFWSKAQELGTLLFMHPGAGNGNDPRYAGKGALGNTIGNPLETTIFLSRLIYEGTLDKFPGLRICGAHAGGYLPSYMGRSESQCGRGNACSSKKRPIEEYFRSQLLADCMIFREEGLRHLVAEMGVGQIVYGTDEPFGWGVTPDFILNASFLSDEEKEQILGGNLIRLLKLPATV